MSTVNEVIEELSLVAKKIRQIEGEAKNILNDQSNIDRYRELMREKAMLLFHLPESIAGLMSSLEHKIALKLKNQIGAFSFSAGKALDLNSVFYMSALLYPEDYVDGGNNDLESYIIELENCR
nr:hypothetical protein [Desulfobulbaceae bacterium]